MIRFILVFISFFSLNLLSSCEDKHHENLDNQPLMVRSVEPVSRLDFKSARLLRPSTNSFSRIGGIDKVLYLENRIIILDQKFANAVFIYDLEGNYVNHIHRVGEGPGEYKNIISIYFEPNLDLLVMIPMDFLKLMYFDLDGNFIREKAHDKSINYSDVVFLEDGQLVINNSSMNGEDNLKLYQNDEVVMTAFPYVSYLDNTPLDQKSLISQIDKEDYLITIGSRDTIYRFNIKTQAISIEYVFDMENAISKVDFGNHPNAVKYFLENDIYVGIIDLFQVGDFLSFTTLSSKGVKGRILDKEKRMLYDTGELIHSEIGELTFHGISGLSSSGEFVAIVSAAETGKWDFSESPELKEQFEKMGDVDSEELLLLFFEPERK